MSTSNKNYNLHLTENFDSVILWETKKEALTKLYDVCSISDLPQEPKGNF